MAFSASESAFEGFRLVRREPMAIVLWALFYLVLTAVVVLAFGGMFGDFFQTMERLESSGAEPTMADVAPLLTFYAVFIPGAIVVGSVIYGAVNRAILRPEERAIGYMRFGGDELRIIAVSLILTLLFIAATVALGIVVGLIVGLLSAVAGDAAAILTIPAVIALYAAMIWFSVRFSLAIPITVAERRIAVFDSWRMTKGHFWGLFGMALLAMVMMLVVYILFSLVAAPIFFFALGGFENLGALETMSPVEIGTTMAPFAIAALVFYAIVSAVMAAIGYAPFASAYLGLSGRTVEAPQPPAEA